MGFKLIHHRIIGRDRASDRPTDRTEQNRDDSCWLAGWKGAATAAPDRRQFSPWQWGRRGTFVKWGWSRSRITGSVIGREGGVRNVDTEGEYFCHFAPVVAMRRAYLCISRRWLRILHGLVPFSADSFRTRFKGVSRVGLVIHSNEQHFSPAFLSPSLKPRHSAS